MPQTASMVSQLVLSREHPSTVMGRTSVARSIGVVRKGMTVSITATRESLGTARACISAGGRNRRGGTSSSRCNDAGGRHARGFWLYAGLLLQRWVCGAHADLKTLRAWCGVRVEVAVIVPIGPGACRNSHGRVYFCMEILRDGVFISIEPVLSWLIEIWRLKDVLVHSYIGGRDVWKWSLIGGG